MFISLTLNWQLISLFFLAVALGFLTWRRPVWGGAAVIFLAPTYLLKIKLSFLPLTALEIFCWVFILASTWFWVLKKATSLTDLFQNKKTTRFYLAAVGAIFLGVLLSAAYSQNPLVGLGIFKSWFLAPALFVLCLGGAIKNVKEIKIILLALFTSGFLVAATSLVYFFYSKLTFDGRLAAFYLSPNHLAMFLAPALITGLGLLVTEKKPANRIIFLAGAATITGAFYLTFSYGAWLAVFGSLLLGLVFVLIKQAGRIKKTSLIGVLLLLVFFASVVFVQLPSQKVKNLMFFERSSAQSRIMVWQAAIKIIADNWFLGIGPGLFQEHYLVYQKYFSVPYLEWAVPQPHNIFLAWWLQAGILGLAGFLLLLCLFFKTSYKNLLTKKPPEEALLDDEKKLFIFILAAVMIYFLLHGLVDTTFWKNDLALIFWTIIALNYKAGHLPD